jgi:acetyl-CoA carboxylase biotin carboxylase subunit
MFKRVMVANRGEVALRVLRTLREIGIESVVALSTLDTGQPFPLADRVICIGAGDPDHSYMNSHRLLSAAIACHVDAIHPGYGFLSEDVSFSRLCGEMGLTFIGPRPTVMEKLGDKAASCHLAGELQIPNLFLGLARDELEAMRLSSQVDFPVVIKPVAGGGGRGIRIVRRPDEFLPLWKHALAETSPRYRELGLYIERYLPEARHLEVQVARDEEGKTVAFPPRDCSLQYRNQKWVEETPPSRCPSSLEEKLKSDAMLMAERCGLVGIATVEFLVSRGDHYFIEVNARLQVEHTITEMISGTDLVREQIRLAAGERLEESPPPRGHAIEVRLYGLPSGSKVGLCLPGGPGIRIDALANQEGPALLKYDPLLAKICAWAPNREQAVSRMRRALGETEVQGASTNLQLLRSLVESEAFVLGEYDNNTLQHTLGGESWISWKE